MSFRITGLSPEMFSHLYDLPDEKLREHRAVRVRVDRTPGFPDRIEVRDVEPGESVLLLNYTHQPADNPYRASHAIFVREGATVAYDAVDEIPGALRLRTISLRAFDSQHSMLDAELADGPLLPETIERLFSKHEVAYLHAHYATRGCYAARIDRA